MDLKYPIYNRIFSGNEKKYVADCIESSWISSKGNYIDLFEKQFGEYIDIPYATTVVNGTAALHLALLTLGIQPGDEIIVPTLTYIATTNAVAYVNAIPVFADSLAHNWQIDPEDIERKITAKTKAVIVVHLYGHPCDMDTIKHICIKHHIYLVEDCAEAIGSRYKGKHVGTFGDISVFSFYGNKTITTGEGGMVVSPDKEMIERAHYIKYQGVTHVTYWHDIIGYNYRMTNICAAIGLAQLENIDEIIKEKTRVANTYRKAFENTSVEFHRQDHDVFHSYWMCSVLINNPAHRDALRDFLLQNGIDSRPVFYPCHTMPMYEKLSDGNFKVANDISYRGINLPSYPDLTTEDINFIAGKIIEFVRNHE